MGTISIAWAAGLRKIGVEPYIPPYTSKKTLSFGTKNSPEAICLPYKLILGNFIEAIEGGADYVAMITSPGICRLGEYGNNIYRTLIDLGYKANYIELSLYDGIKGLYKFLKDISGKNDPILIMRAINITMRKIFAIDDLDKALSYYRAREIKFGDAEKNYKKALRIIDKVDSTNDLKKAYEEALKEILKRSEGERQE
jgi:predicted nucleotide-binding protein (sugar kinase/HSP70/actin superfamily)